MSSASNLKPILKELLERLEGTRRAAETLRAEQCNNKIAAAQRRDLPIGAGLRRKRRRATQK